MILLAAQITSDDVTIYTVTLLSRKAVVQENSVLELFFNTKEDFGGKC